MLRTVGLSGEFQIICRKLTEYFNPTMYDRKPNCDHSSVMATGMAYLKAFFCLKIDNKASLREIFSHVMGLTSKLHHCSFWWINYPNY